MTDKNYVSLNRVSEARKEAFPNGETRPVGEYHYFLSSFDLWVVGGDLNLALKRFWKESISPHCAIYRVPLAVDADYSIAFYAPEVPGAQLIEEVYRSQKEFDKAEKSA